MKSRAEKDHLAASMERAAAAAVPPRKRLVYPQVASIDVEEFPGQGPNGERAWRVVFRVEHPWELIEFWLTREECDALVNLLSGKTSSGLTIAGELPADVLSGVEG